MIENEILKKQFLMSGKNLATSNEVPQDTKCVRLKSGRYLYYGDGLDVVTNSDASCIIIGDAWQLDPDRLSPRELIEKMDEKTPEDEVYDTEYTWAGRYVLVVGDTLYLDCFGHRGVFYGNGCVSSSLTALCQLFGIDLVYPKIKHGISGLDNMPGEDTMYEQFKRVLPSQVLSLKDMHVHHRPLLPHGIEAYESEEARTEAFKKYFENGLRNMRAQLEGRFMFALTGGADSRTTFALLNDAGIDFDTFTLQFDRMDPGDRTVPPMLAKLCGKSYQIVGGGGVQQYSA